MNRSLTLFALITLGVGLCGLLAGSPATNAPQPSSEPTTMPTHLDTITLGGGCFWCIEAIFQSVKGVHKVTSGYAGGHVKMPTYEQVSTGTTNHAEVVQIEFEPSVITFSDLLEVFFHLHDPTTKNAQGADVGTQYRSVVFYKTEAERAAAEVVIKKIEAQKVWSMPIVTTIEPYTEFYPAESYHQNYYKNNKNKPYCSIVIAPKIQKLYREFGDKLKEAPKG